MADDFRGRSSWIDPAHLQRVAMWASDADCAELPPGDLYPTYPIESRRNCRQTITSLRLHNRQVLKPENFPLPLMPKVVPQDARLHEGVRDPRCRWHELA